MLQLLLALPILLFLSSGPLQASPGSSKIFLHARPAVSGETCSPALANCAAANVMGFLDTQVPFYYLYIMAYCPTASGLEEIHTGIDYDLRTVSGVDIFSWNLCADSETQEAGWYQEGGANRIHWNTCRTDSLIVAGYFYVTAYSPTYFALTAPPADSAAVTGCGGSPVHLAPTSLGYLGFGGEEGCNPCKGDCFYTPVESVTWSRIKNSFRSR